MFPRRLLFRCSLSEVKSRIAEVFAGWQVDEYAERETELNGLRADAAILECSARENDDGLALARQQLLVHMVVIGLPISFSVRRFAK